MTSEAHWDEVYRTKEASEVSWYQPSPEPSLQAIERLAVSPAAALVDVGGGASNLVDGLLDRGWSDLTVVDIAAPALQVSRKRLGPSGDAVAWEIADITNWKPARSYDVWHDRAVFHFLTTADARDGYRAALEGGTASGSMVIMATFALDGPEKCSGLPVRRYDAESLSRELGPSFQLLESWEEGHSTPNGNLQAFTWSIFRRMR